jgi:hypothetical protein
VVVAGALVWACQAVLVGALETVIIMELVERAVALVGRLLN